MDWAKWKSFKENKNLNEKVELDGKSIPEVLQAIDSLRDSTFIFFDTETGGFDPQFDQITQIAGISVSYKDGKAVEQEKINLYSVLTPEMEERISKDGPAYEEWLERQLPSLQKLERTSTGSEEEEDERQVKMELARDPKFVLRLTGYIKQKGYSFDTQEELLQFLFSNNPNTKEQVKAFVKNYTPSASDEQEFSLHGTATANDQSEEKVLQDFLDFVKDNDNVILVAHNSDFDMKMVNGRSKKYGLPQLKEGENIKDVLDSLQMATTYRESLEFLLKKYKKELEEMDLESISSVFDKSQAVMPKPEQMEEEYKSSFLSKTKTYDVEDEPIDINANIDSLTSSTLKQINEFPPEQREQVLKVISLNTLIRSLENTLGRIKGVNTRFSRKLGDLASNMKRSPEGWHDALADVRMLMGVFNDMYRTIKMAAIYQEEGVEGVVELKKEFSLISEMEVYQQIVTAKHPAAKKRLTTGGKVKDKSTPYKIKLSLKRGKSAPPGFGGA